VIDKVKEIISELDGLVFKEKNKFISNFDYTAALPFVYINDGHYDGRVEDEYDHLLFYQFREWLFRFVYKEDSFHYWDDDHGDWVKTDITDIPTLLALYK